MCGSTFRQQEPALIIRVSAIRSEFCLRFVEGDANGRRGRAATERSVPALKNKETVFQFYPGHIWRQKHSKYHYHYAYMPYARVVGRNGGYELEVDGVADRLEVVKVR